MVGSGGRSKGFGDLESVGFGSFGIGNGPDTATMIRCLWKCFP